MPAAINVFTKIPRRIFARLNHAANAGSATGVDRGEELFWALANLAYAALVTLAIGNRFGSLSRECLCLAVIPRDR